MNRYNYPTGGDHLLDGDEYKDRLGEWRPHNIDADGRIADGHTEYRRKIPDVYDKAMAMTKDESTETGIALRMFRAAPEILRAWKNDPQAATLLNWIESWAAEASRIEMRKENDDEQG